MSDKSISDLRRCMLQDTTNRNFGDKTQRDYIRHIESFAKFLGRAPTWPLGIDCGSQSGAWHPTATGRCGP